MLTELNSEYTWEPLHVLEQEIDLIRWVSQGNYSGNSIDWVGSNSERWIEFGEKEISDEAAVVN